MSSARSTIGRQASTPGDGDLPAIHADGPGPFEPMRWAGVATWLAIAWLAGTALGLAWQKPAIWLGAGVVLAAGLGLHRLMRGRGGSITKWCLAMSLAAAAAGAWTSVSSTALPGNHLGRYVKDERQLVRLVGWVDQWPRMASAPAGAMARFGHHQPATLYELRVTGVQTATELVEVTGRVLVRQPGRDARLAPGQRVSVVGWLTGPSRPRNPGEMDFSQWMIDRGLAGFLSVDDPGAWQQLSSGDKLSRLSSWRGRAGSLAMVSLGQGMERWPVERAFLNILLLGRQGHGLEKTQTAFRRVGLAHLLSISGAHLGMLVAMVAVVLVMMGVRPWVGAGVVAIVLGLYLLAVPWQVPVLRAAIMAMAVVLGHALGRRVAALDPLALACIVMLIWRPGEMMTPGFQLSFGVVAALIRFTGPVARWMTPWPHVAGQKLRLSQRAAGWMLGYVGANVVAFAVSVPLVMYHFQNISPLTVFMSIATLPWVSVVMAGGYLKILVGLLLPGLGGDLAWPVWWLTHQLLELVGWGSQWRMSYLELAYPPSAGWTAAALLVIAATLAGTLRQRPWALGVCVMIVAGWLAVGQMGYRTHQTAWAASPRSAGQVALRMNVFAVGDGNCYLLRFPSADGKTYTLMYDCGGQRVDAGVRSILPALHELGVRRIDTLVISHADMDHFNGVIDLARRVWLGQVLVSPQMMASVDDPATRPAPIFLLRQLQDMGLDVQAIARGWSLEQKGLKMTALWPVAEFTAGPDNDNDLSIVLRLETAGRRVLLGGDIQQQAIGRLLAMQDEQAQAIGPVDVTDMPHHGSFTGKPSLRWIETLQPRVLIQSSGLRRVERDPWQGLVDPRTLRLQTGSLGMIELDIHHDGKMFWRHFPITARHAVESLPEGQ